jgi:hypothetical protein
VSRERSATRVAGRGVNGVGTDPNQRIYPPDEALKLVYQAFEQEGTARRHTEFLGTPLGVAALLSYVCNTQSEICDWSTKTSPRLSEDERFEEYHRLISECPWYPRALTLALQICGYPVPVPSAGQRSVDVGLLATDAVIAKLLTGAQDAFRRLSEGATATESSSPGNMMRESRTTKIQAEIGPLPIVLTPERAGVQSVVPAVRASDKRQPLSDQARILYEILATLPEMEGRTAAQLVECVARRGYTVDEDRVRRLVKELREKAYEVLRSRASGYYVRMSPGLGLPRGDGAAGT